MNRCAAIWLLSVLLAPLAHADCAWIYPKDPLASPACEQVLYPPRTSDQPFRIVDQVHGITLDQALTASRSTPPAGIQRSEFPITRQVREWGLRGVAHHLGRAHEFLRLELGRRFTSRTLNVRLTNQHGGMGLFRDSSVQLGGYGELASEVIYHEYGHHVIEWERPGVTAMRDSGGRVAYGIIEAWCNHLAFALDEEPRFSEYFQTINGAASQRYIYSVDNSCTTRGCPQAVFGVDDSYKAVVLYGGLLWDLHREAGAKESVALMLDSLAMLDLRQRLDYASAIRALLAADRALHGSRWQGLLLRQAHARFPELDF
jgi:hypothetical protein